MIPNKVIARLEALAMSEDMPLIDNIELLFEWYLGHTFGPQEIFQFKNTFILTMLAMTLYTLKMTP